jgi:LCP family protein required for cell wall assembly
VSGLEVLLRSFARRYVIAFGVTAVFMVGAVLMVNYVIDAKLSSIERLHLNNTSRSSTDVANFLLIGSDTRAFVHDKSDATSFGTQGTAGGQRSDTLMVVHVDPGHHHAIVVSFPRDLWVDIPGVPLDTTHCSSISTGTCKSKINSAFNTGPDTVIQTLKQNFDIPINHYVEIDFKSFQGIVDAVGTVPIYFPYPSRDDETGLYMPVPGCKLLDGKAALAYARARHLQYYSFPNGRWYEADPSADLGRIKRQQDFMKKMASVAIAHSLNDPVTANDVVDAILKNLKVDSGLTKDDLLSLVDVFRSVNPNDSSHVEFLTIPSQNGSAGTLSVLYLRQPDAMTVLKALRDLSGTTPMSLLTTTTTVPRSTTSNATPVTTAPTTPAPIANKSKLGPPAQTAPPC